MRRRLLTWMLACTLTCGCAGRINSDLLQARIREQSAQLTDSQREVTKTRSELKRTRMEADRLKSELAQFERGDDAVRTSPVQIGRIHIYSMASGGLNKDELPGDDAVVVQFVPLDQDNEPIKIPGQLEFTLVDPQLPESVRELGKWNFSADECRSHWTRGITSSGFQFNLPFERAPDHSDLVVHLKFQTSDDRRFDVSHAIKVVVPTGNAVVKVKRARPQPIRVTEELDEFLPPVGDSQQYDDGEFNLSAGGESEARSTKPGHTVLHSSNWTEATIPQLR